MSSEYRPDPFRQRCGRVDALATAGAAPPAEWVALRERFSAFLELNKTTPMRSRMAAGVVSGSSDADLELLRAAALAEQLGPETVTNGVRTAASFEPYAEPAPLELRSRPTGLRGISEEYLHDPEESPGHEPAPEPVTRRALAR